MVHFIAGQKGKGKTTELLDRVNTEIKTAKGSIVFLDRNSKHMYELNNRVRLIDVSNYGLENEDQFFGFVAGIISQDNDLQSVYIDGFLKCAHLKDKDITPTVKKLDALSKKFEIEFIISVSLDKSELSEEIQDKVLVAL